MRPHKDSTMEEILAYQPTGWADGVRWFHEKKELLNLKKMRSFWQHLTEA
jgi:hypothetical protein